MKSIFPILFVLGINIITIALSNRNGTGPIRNLKAHHELVTNFSCNNPQLRSIPVRDLLSPNPEKRYFPFSTVLARCDEHSGCCENDSICSPRDKSIVELEFLVDDVVDKTQTHQIVRAENHTRCHCVGDSKTINTVTTP